MDPRQAARDLEVIRTMMERTVQYQFLTAWAGLAAGSMAAAGALAFLVLDAADPKQFGVVWAAVFAGELLSTIVGTAVRSRVQGKPVWTRSTRIIVLSLLPGLFTAGVLTILFFDWGQHLWLPGVWMLCYGQGALATAAYAPRPIRWLGGSMLALGAGTLALSPAWSVLMMGLTFGLGHIVLGVSLLALERRQVALRLHSEVA
jgi:hypothetical protein